MAADATSRTPTKPGPVLARAPAPLGRELARWRTLARAGTDGLARLWRAARTAPQRPRRAAMTVAAAVAAVVIVALIVDAPAARAARHMPDIVLRVFGFVTDFGKGWVALLPALLAMLWFGRASLVAASRRESSRLRFLAERASFVVCAVALSSVVTTILKHLVGRERPRAFEISGPFHFEPFSVAASRASFPSGHAATVVALAVAVSAVAPRWRRAVWLFALVICVSRVSLEAHYVSDVLGGALVGLLCAKLALAVFASARIGFARGGMGAARPRTLAVASAMPFGTPAATAWTETLAMPAADAASRLAPPLTLSVVVPMRNEADNAAPLIAEIERACAPLAPFELICVDDGSIDATPARLAALAREKPFLRVLSHAASCGQSAAVRSGVLAARAPTVVTLDGDGQNDPAFIPNLVAALEEGGSRTGLAAGQRLGRKDTGFKRVQSRIANAVRGRVLQDGTRDTGCGLKAFRRDAFLALPYFDALHRFLPALMRREGYRVSLVDVVDRPRRSGQSNYGLFDRLWVGILDLAGVWWLIRRRRRVPAVMELRKDA